MNVVHRYLGEVNRKKPAQKRLKCRGGVHLALKLIMKRKKLKKKKKVKTIVLINICFLFIGKHLWHEGDSKQWLYLLSFVKWANATHIITFKNTQALSHNHTRARAAIMTSTARTAPTRQIPFSTSFENTCINFSVNLAFETFRAKCTKSYIPSSRNCVEQWKFVVVTY